MSMKPSLGQFLSLTGALMVVVPVTGAAQDYFRDYGTSRSSGGLGPIWPSDYTYHDVSPSGLESLDPLAVQKEAQQNNFAIGPVRFSMAVGVGVEYNDNITYAETGREHDVIIRPTLNVEADLRLSDMNTLRFSLGISYAKYLDHSEFDTSGVVISPASELEATVMFGQVKVTARDRFSYQEDPFAVPEVSNVAKYDRYENQAGIKAEYEFNSRAGISVGYDHYNLWTTESLFSDQDRSIDTVFIKPYIKPSEALKIGVNASYSRIAFDSSNRSDGYSVLAGPFVEWQITPNTNAYLEVGYQDIQFDGSYVPTNLLDQLSLDLTPDQRAAIETEASDSQGNDSYYVRFELDNKPSEVFKHRISFSKTSEVGFFSDYYDLYHVEYDAEYTGIRKVGIGPSIFYEYYETSGNIAEKANRIGATLGLRYYLTNSLTLGLDYRYLWKDSNLAGADYTQNLVFLSAYYKF